MDPGRAQLQNWPLGTTLCTSSIPFLPLHSRGRRHARFHSSGYVVSPPPDASLDVLCKVQTTLASFPDLADHLDAGSGRLCTYICTRMYSTLWSVRRHSSRQSSRRCFVLVR
ncbi:hypothetical protein FVEG_15598 [Fusarium verticillioides 7600]|uniref:Uncharacterized protein n=1 Tax=Gibberella moniliformis (strain M3125 / FGSC 7600) TaxID=334819 RepID=W7M8K0_GIBM7|nr:hypothetical protein FVEG_15598 [Fusarium verticillioides 7600]EWG43789.1 hypothetical protein FVEG_15598 [Fusarium verticillioides 7600]